MRTLLAPLFKGWKSGSWVVVAVAVAVLFSTFFVKVNAGYRLFSLGGFGRGGGGGGVVGRGKGGGGGSGVFGIS